MCVRVLNLVFEGVGVAVGKGSNAVSLNYHIFSSAIITLICLRVFILIKQLFLRSENSNKS